MPQITGWPVYYPASSTFAASQSTVNAMTQAFGKQVDDGTRKVVLAMVDSFHVCGYSLDSYTFKLRWVGDLAHSGGHGAAVVDITHGGDTYRMVGYDTYKGVQLGLPFQLTGDTVTRVEAATWELDQQAQIYYELVVAAPGSKVAVSAGSAAPTTVTVGPSGVAEVEFADSKVNNSFPLPATTDMVTRPDGSTAAVPQVIYTKEVAKAARQLLPADTSCQVASVQ
jgi:hypothetical protein